MGDALPGFGSSRRIQRRAECTCQLAGSRNRIRMRLRHHGRKWSCRLDSHQRPARYKGAALLVELRQQDANWHRGMESNHQPSRSKRDAHPIELPRYGEAKRHGLRAGNRTRISTLAAWRLRRWTTRRWQGRQESHLRCRIWNPKSWLLDDTPSDRSGLVGSAGY